MAKSKNGPVTVRKLGEESTQPTSFGVPIDMAALRAKYPVDRPSAIRETMMSPDRGRTWVPWHPAMGSPAERDFSSPVGSAKHEKPSKPRIRIAISPWAGGSCIQSIREAGGEAVEIRGDTALSEFESCTGLLIPGGRDVDPSLYNAERGWHTQPGDLERDHFEMDLVRYAMRHKKNILGICRGHQLLNVALGGTLIQHIEDAHPYKHQITIQEDSELLRFMGTDIYVNSLHHQAVQRPGKGLRVAAYGHDGTIEAIEHTKRKFVLGVQFHPEMRGVTPRFNREMKKLFRQFVTAGQPA